MNLDQAHSRASGSHDMKKAKRVVNVTQREQKKLLKYSKGPVPEYLKGWSKFARAMRQMAKGRTDWSS